MQGQIYSLLSALTWSAGLVLFRLSSVELKPIALNLFKNVVALLLFGATLLFVAGTTSAAASFTPREWAVLAISGILGIALADTIFFFALQRLGVGLIAIVDCIYSPMVVLFAWLLLRETLGWLQLVGGGLILTAVVVAAGARSSAAETGARLWVGVAAAVIAVTLMAFGIVICTPVLRDHANTPALLVMTTIRLAAGTLVLVVITPFTNERRSAWRVFVPSPVWRTGIPAAAIGTFLCLICWVSGFTYTVAGVAALLNQTSVLWSLLLASVLLREPFGRHKLAAVVLAILGILLVFWGDAPRAALALGVISAQG